MLFSWSSEKHGRRQAGGGAGTHPCLGGFHLHGPSRLRLSLGVGLPRAQDDLRAFDEQIPDKFRACWPGHLKRLFVCHWSCPNSGVKGLTGQKRNWCYIDHQTIAERFSRP